MIEPAAPIERFATLQAGVARLPVLLVSLLLTASLLLVALDRLFLPERFAIREVIVAGDAPNVDPAAVLKTVRELGPRSWFSVDLAEVETAAGTVPWVYRASVRRRWPGKLVVTVEQAEPFAHWNDDDWINESGELLKLPANFNARNLPRLAGPAGSAARVAEQYRRLDGLFEGSSPVSVRSLSISARGVWRLGVAARLAGDERVIDITIGREHVVERVARLALALRGGIEERFAGALAIDLRYPNGFAVTFARDDKDRVVRSVERRSGADTG